MCKGLHHPGIVHTDRRSINSEFLVSRGVFLSNGMRHVCVNCVDAEQWAWEEAQHFDGGAAVRIWRKLKDWSYRTLRTVISDSYLKIWLAWHEKDCFSEMGSLYAFNSSFFYPLAWNMVFFYSNPESQIQSSFYNGLQGTGEKSINTKVHYSDGSFTFPSQMHHIPHTSLNNDIVVLLLHHCSYFYENNHFNIIFSSWTYTIFIHYLWVSDRGVCLDFPQCPLARLHVVFAVSAQPRHHRHKHFFQAHCPLPQLTDTYCTPLDRKKFSS